MLHQQGLGSNCAEGWLLISNDFQLAREPPTGGSHSLFYSGINTTNGVLRLRVPRPDISCSFILRSRRERKRKEKRKNEKRKHAWLTPSISMVINREVINGYLVLDLGNDLQDLSPSVLAGKLYRGLCRKQGTLRVL